jgi:ammonium transporter Rh
MFAMIGTVFLWMFWPSFNAALGGSDELRHLAVVNTVLSLCGSCMMAFMCSYYFRGKEFCMVDIQNATLAGGVAMGTSADLYGNSGTSILIGAFAGVVSVVGYTKIQPLLEEKLGLHDTCGVHNLHGMPSVIGAVCGIITITANGNTDFDAGEQFGFMCITLLISILTGAITGGIAGNFQAVDADGLFQDQVDWEVPHEELPYFFDNHGEISREEPTDAKYAKQQETNDLSIMKARLDTMQEQYQNKIALLESRLSVATAGSSGDVTRDSMQLLEGMFQRFLANPVVS